MSSVILLENDSISSDDQEGISNVDKVKEPAESLHDKPEIPLAIDDRSYDETEAVDIAENSNGDKEKPLLDLMKNLIKCNGKQNTTLTNYQLKEILRKEFALDLANSHFMSVDIYMNVLKKFLKAWPQWDKFEQVMHEIRCMTDEEEIKRMLEEQYNTLKDYLAAIIKASQPFAREAVQKLKRSQEIPETSEAIPGDVIMEINCTRDQLNTLFFRKPHPEFKSTIFNINNSLPSKITLNAPSIESILNSCYVNITINTSCFKYKRELTHNFKHMLVNKKLKQLKRDPPLNAHLQTPKTSKHDSFCNKNDLKQIINKIQKSCQCSTELQNDFDTVFRVVSKDLDVLAEATIGVPGMFRHYLSCYPYVRHLYKDVEAHSKKYDLQLEEKASPMLKFHISKLVLGKVVNTEENWLKMECSVCQERFLGLLGLENLKIHFRDCHQNEPNWFCVRCDREFTATHLGMARWYHKCEVINMETD